MKSEGSHKTELMYILKNSNLTIATKSVNWFSIEVKNQMFPGTLAQASSMNVKKLMFE